MEINKMLSLLHEFVREEAQGKTKTEWLESLYSKGITLEEMIMDFNINQKEVFNFSSKRLFKDIKVAIYGPKGNPYDAFLLAQHSNTVNINAGGKAVFLSDDFYFGKKSRVQGQHCDCPTVEVDGCEYPTGVYYLFETDSTEVYEGGKAYMRCAICGCISHL